MKLYAHPHLPRKEMFYTGEHAPASCYRLQQQLLAAYHEVLFHWWDIDRLLTTCFGPRRGKRLQAAEDRVQYEVPEMIERMTPAELAAAAQVFLQQTLVGFINHVLQQERSIVWRLKEGNCYTRLGDDGHAKAAGLGKVFHQQMAKRPNQGARSAQQGSCPHAALLAELGVSQLPATHTQPGLIQDAIQRLIADRDYYRDIALRSSAPPALASPGTPTAATLHRQRAKRAQERKRLKRKRR